ncbi:ParB N-terminal domain-containing protein [Streptomyces sp. NPDC047028]|uniref:ParB N-terminal domain-containing protein n=1 Tax=Streptomyces sp. NPDC047028 TaxID=3155793 RepID=UPI0033E9604E
MKKEEKRSSRTPDPVPQVTEVKETKSLDPSTAETVMWKGRTLVLMDISTYGGSEEERVARVDRDGNRFAIWDKLEKNWYYLNESLRSTNEVVEAATVSAGRDYGSQKHYNYPGIDDVMIMDLAKIVAPSGLGFPDGVKLKKIKEEIRDGKVIWPIQVKPTYGTPPYRISGGRHRYQASKDSNFTQIPVTLAESDEV